MQTHVMLAIFSKKETHTTQDTVRRLNRIRKQIEDVKGRILDIYERLGAYDLVVILEIPDSNTWDRIENEFGSSDIIVNTRLLGPRPLARYRPVGIAA